MYNYVTSFFKTSEQVKFEKAGNDFISNLKTYEQELKDSHQRCERRITESRERIIGNFNNPPIQSSLLDLKKRKVTPSHFIPFRSEIGPFGRVE